MNSTVNNRYILAQITNQLENDLIIILIGARQVGKTFLVKNLLTEYFSTKYPTAKYLYLDLEKPDILEHFINYQSIVNYLAGQGLAADNTNFIIIDEFQKMPEPTKTLKILHDHFPHLKIIATGSSALDIYQKLRAESLAGRKRVFSVYPLDFAEYLNFTDNVNLTDVYSRLLANDQINSASFLAELNPVWENFAIWGGYPRVALLKSDAERAATLAEIYQAYLERDITGILKESDAIPFTKMVSLLAVQVGNIFNANEIAKQLGVSRFKLDRYLFVLEKTFIIQLVPPFFTNRQKEIIKMPKLFFLDNGLRNWAVKNHGPLDLRSDNGRLMENSVFAELLKHLPLGVEIHFWRTPQGAEVDFVLTAGAKIIPVEVKFQNLEKASVPSGLKAFIERYHPQTAFVLSKNFSGQIEYDNCAIKFLPAFMAAKIAMNF